MQTNISKEHKIIFHGLYKKEKDEDELMLVLSQSLLFLLHIRSFISYCFTYTREIAVILQILPEKLKSLLFIETILIICKSANKKSVQRK